MLSWVAAFAVMLAVAVLTVHVWGRHADLIVPLPLVGGVDIDELGSWLAALGAGGAARLGVMHLPVR